MKPKEIEQNSFSIIKGELGPHSFSEQELAVVVRVIHATADFEYRSLLMFQPDEGPSHAVRAGISAIKTGCSILTDVRMVQAGISKKLLASWNGQVMCDIDHPDVAEMAKQQGVTRSIIAMRRNKDLIHNNIVAIGNAPTALMEVCRLVRECGIRPALIVGVPVGFVNTVESKQELLELKGVPVITSVGRKGGSSVAVAIINALMHLARDETERL